MKTTLDEALVQWSAETARRMAFAGGYTALLLPYLAGWAMRDMGATEPTLKDLGTYGSSFRAGWRACDSTITIKMRDEPHAFKPDPEGRCHVCGLAKHHDCHAPPLSETETGEP